MLLRIPWVAVALVLAPLVAACGGEEGDPTGSTCPPDSMLTYENWGQAFFATNCVSAEPSEKYCGASWFSCSVAEMMSMPREPT